MAAHDSTPVRQVRQDIIGKRFGHWVVQSFARSNGKGKSWWTCRCDCGAIKDVSRSTLTEGTSRSCGCQSPKFAPVHGGTHTPEHVIWIHMKVRCNPSNAALRYYKNYAGRGITVCQRWMDSFEAFLEDMGPRPSPKHSIDRIDNNGNYEPSNCRWATGKQQCRNTRRTKMAEYQGVVRPLVEWAELFGVNIETLRTRLRKGMKIGAALTRPCQRGRVLVPSSAKPKVVRSGEMCSHSKITWAIAREIKRRAMSGENQGSIAADFNVSRSLVGLIKKGKVWVNPEAH